MLLLAGALNLAGIACFALAAPEEAWSAGAMREAVSNPARALDTIGLSLMLPGVLFAAVFLLGAKAGAGSAPAAFGLWQAAGFALNFAGAWRAGGIFAGARKEEEEEARRRAAEEEG